MNTPGPSLTELVVIAALVILTATAGWILLGPLALWGIPLLAWTAWRLARGEGAGWMLRWMRAMPLRPEAAPGLTRALRTLGERAGLPEPPRLFLLDQAAPNAFAMRVEDRPVVAVSRGLLQALSPRAVTGVLAHEVGHLAAGDTRLLAVARTLAGSVQTLARFGVVLLWLSLPLVLVGAVEGPGAALLIVLFGPVIAAALFGRLSRSREFAADATAARLLGDGRPLAEALRTLQAHEARAAGLAARFGAAPVPPWLRSHPDTAERIRRLGHRPSGITVPSPGGWPVSGRPVGFPPPLVGMHG